MEKSQNNPREDISLQQELNEVRRNAFGNVLNDEDQKRIVGKTLELLEKGHPIVPDDIATMSHLSPEKVFLTLHSLGTEFDGQGNVVGFGLTFVPTAHTHECDGCRRSRGSNLRCSHVKC